MRSVFLKLEGKMLPGISNFFPVKPEEIPGKNKEGASKESTIFLREVDIFQDSTKVNNVAPKKAKL